jgi:hypothetical protein
LGAHSVTLTCTASIDSVTGYNFYRGTAAGAENFSTPINGSTPISTCGFIDTNVSAGVTYFYVAQAVVVNGSSTTTSANSNEAGSGPVPIAPATNLKAVPQ